MTGDANQKGPGTERTAAEGLAMLRDAAATGDPELFENTFNDVVVAARMGFWSSFWARFRIRMAMCTNYAGIIRVCDSIIGDPSSTPEQVAWAQNKKAEAQRGAAEQGCPPPNVS